MRSTWLPTNIVLGVLVRTTPDIPNFGQEIKKEILSFFYAFLQQRDRLRRGIGGLDHAIGANMGGGTKVIGFGWLAADLLITLDG